MTRRQFLIACLLGTSLFVFLPSASAQSRVSSSPLAAQADTFALENGLRVTLLPYASESVGATLELRAGHAYTSSSHASSALARAIAAASPDVPLEPTTDADGIRLTGEVPEDRVDSLLTALAYAVQRPVVNADVLASPQADTTVRSRAVSSLRRVLFGAHPYAPSDADPAALSEEDVRTLHESYGGARNAHLFVTGGLQADDVAARIRSAFQDWPSGSASSLPPVPDAPSPPEFTLVDVASSSDAAVVAGRRVDVSPRHPDYLALRVADALIGGAYTSRIPRGLRRTLGRPVSAKSQIVSHANAAYWMQTVVAPAGAADSVLQTVFDALRDLRAGTPPRSDVEAARDYVARSVAMQDATPSGVAEHLADLARHGLGPDALKRRIDAIYAVTPEDVHRIAVRYLAPDALHVTAAGNRNVLGDRLSPFFPTAP